MSKFNTGDTLVYTAWDDVTYHYVRTADNEWESPDSPVVLEDAFIGLLILLAESCPDDLTFTPKGES